MRHELGTFPGRPSSTPGSCRFCGVGYLRAGETGVIVTDKWIDQEGVIVLCEACAAEVGRLAPNPEKAGLEAEVATVLANVAAKDALIAQLLGIVESQRAEMALVPPPPAPEPSPEPAPAAKPATRRK